MIFDSEEDGCYVADIPDLCYCSAFGETPQEALAEVLIAKRAWLESARRHGDPVPEPHYRPLIPASPPVLLPRWPRRFAQHRADDRGVSKPTAGSKASIPDRTSVRFGGRSRQSN